jgi:hypothetical protein
MTGAIARQSAFEHIVPHGEQGFGQGGGFVQRHVFGHRQAVLPMRSAIFGVASAGGECGNVLPDHLARDFVADRDDFARDLQPQ